VKKIDFKNIRLKSVMALKKFGSVRKNNFRIMGICGRKCPKLTKIMKLFFGETENWVKKSSKFRV